MSAEDYKVTARFNGGRGGATVKIDLNANGRLFSRSELVEFALRLLGAAAIPGTLDLELAAQIRRIGAAPERVVLPVTVKTEPDK